MSIKDADVAVIGMSCRFPGADSVSRFWENLCAGRESIRSLDDEQLRAAGVPEADIGADSYVKVTAMLDDVDRFDPGFFKISPLQAELMDPQIRLLLQCAWEALEDAGYAAKEPQNIGVFAGSGGITSSYFSHFVNVNRQFEKITASPTQLGNDKDFLATFLSYKLNLTGPSVTVQTACSTAMVALHQARQSLLNGECDMALAGGVSVRVPHGHGYHAKEGFIFSRSGRMRAFDAGADGVVFGSGLGLVVIKRLKDAIADGDNIYAVVKGSAISNDGRNKLSYAASSARGQIACVRSALKNADVDAGSIGFLESHGTGTAMGDPEEVKALTAAFKEQTDRKGYCRLGAVKTNVGHLDVASGIVSFIKATLAVRTGIVPPTLHYSKPNPRIRFENTPFYVNTSLQQWSESGTPRRAAINSLGMGGTNAFVILEEYVPQARVEVDGPEAPVVVPLSARTQSSLQQYAQKLLTHVSATDETIHLDDLAYTLQTGRKAMECRIALVVSSMAELRAALSRYLETGVASEPALQLASQWIAGTDVEWSELHTGKRLRRISLPTYVFERERYWIESQAPDIARAVIHPLLHLNTSDLNEQRYTSRFSGEEFFLKDHQVRAAAEVHKVLPGVAYLEMARAAIQQAAPGTNGTLELCDIVWVQPLVVSSEQQVSIALVAKDSRIDFEIFGTQERIHCQGQARFGAHTAPARIDLSQLREQMRQGDHSAAEIYGAFDRMGLHYGPAHRTVETIHRGEGQRLARLVLPVAQQSSRHEFVLHPGLMDGALQAAAGLLWDCAHIPGRPFVPFALETLRAFAACPAELFVWARHSGDKLDIDVCDPDGNVCVQMLGLSFRALGKEMSGDFLATAVWETHAIEARTPMEVERYVILGDLSHIDAERLGSHCMHVTLPDDQGIVERYRSVALTTLEKLQSLMWSKPLGDVRLQLVLPVGDGSYIYAGLAGMLKTAQLENPRVSAQILFVPSDIQADALGALLLAECGQTQETVIEYRDGVRRTVAWRAVEGEPEARFHAGSVFKDHGVYLITGGTGGLGAIFAREILERAPTAKIILTGRATPEELTQSPTRATVLESLQAIGKVEYRQLNLCDPSHVEQVIQAVHQDYQQLNGVIHSAGATRDSFILRKTADELRDVFEPKVSGTVHLDFATRNIDLDFLVLFSALGAAVGNLGQADYVAANGFLDQFAIYRNHLVTIGQRRGRTLAIRWPFWEDGGMQLDESGRDMLRERTGTFALQSQTGIRLFYRSLASGCDQTLAMEGDLQKMQQLLRMDELAREVSTATRAPSESEESATLGDLQQRTEDYLRKEFCSLLKLSLDTVDARAPLENYGIDSIIALDFTRQLEQTFGSLSKTLFFEYLTLRDLAGYFVNAHAQRLNSMFARTAASQSPASKSVEAKSTEGSVSSIRFKRAFDGKSVLEPATHAEPIAIIGLSGRYPQARNLNELWANLRDGKDCIVEVPADRWDWREYYSEDRSQRGHHFSKWGGFIDGVDEFDARFFNISAVEAQSIDPQERLFLEHAWMAMEDAGYTRASLQKPAEGAGLAGQVGVYAGVMYGEYQLFGAESSLQGQRTAFASNPASIANRVSYVLNLHGPSMVVDTMCSSSLTAIHLACQDLQLGRTSAAIAGGVNVTIHPNKYLMLSAGQFISGDGHCQSFGEGGDGYIPGEGVGVVLLKRLSDAQRDADHIYGVIRGSALSHGGKTNGYTVPNPLAQADAIRQALAVARVDARDISYIEAHGTGTKLGDPIEIAALSKVFAESTTQTQFCLIGSAKSNIGHAEAAAGIAGLTKVLLQLKHQQIVPSLHSSRLNPHIDFDTSPFVVSQRLQTWEQPMIDGRRMPRIAGISSFGAGGSNAHLVIEEYVPTSDTDGRSDATYIVPLSARTAEQLQQKARDLLAFIATDAAATPLRSIAYTLQAGREPMDERCAVLASSVEQLAARLQRYLDGSADLEGVYVGQVKANKETLSLLTRDADLHATLDKWIADGKLTKLAELWAKGLELEWTKFYTRAPRWISLPTYPFARQRHWVETVARAPRVAATEVIHPLVHRNRSNFKQQSYTSTFTGEEFFVTGAKGSKCLAPAAYLEMARVAVEHAMPAPSNASALELRNVAWAVPSVPVENERVTIALFDLVDDQVKFEIFTGEDAQTVHCQGEASYSKRPAPPRLDIGALRQRNDYSVAELRLPAELVANCSEYVLHPTLLTDELLTAGASHPVDVESVRAVFPARPLMFACVRQGAGEIDLCDEQGNVCIQIRGVRAQLPIVEAQSPTPALVLEPKRLALDFDSFERPLLSKPKASISLAELGDLNAELPPFQPARVTLSHDRTFSVLDHGNGLFEIQLGHHVLSGQLIDELLQALRTLREQSSLKVLLISGSERYFLTGESAAARQLHEAITAFPFPTIASMRGAASGAGMTLGTLCDFKVLSESASYSGAGIDAALRSGQDLRQAGWTCPIVPDGEVDACARRLAADLTDKPQLALRLLKQHLARDIRVGANDRHADRLRAVESVPAEQTSGSIAAAISIPLRSKVITATVHPGGVVVVRMEDRDAKNMFSDAFTSGMREVFAHVERDPVCKVVLLTGYDHYFSSGGTPETLLAIHEGKVRFTDNTVFHLPLACSVPVIAAMQGHAIGAGWALGMFADFTLLSAESKYFSPYMGYGFTPGAAATLIFPHRIGYDLARETLLTAREYSGAELRERGLAHPVLPRDQVVSAAMSLAAVVAQRPRAQLIALKEQWARVLREQLQQTFDLELAMHERTFVGQADTLARIRSSLAMDRVPAATSATRTVATSASTSIANVGSIADDLRGMLSHELRLPAQEISDDEPFVNLGLDSITGVTWIRRINEKYGTSIEAIKVYSYPTLAQLAQQVRDEAAKLARHEQPAPAEPERTVARPITLTQTTRSLSSWRKPRSAKTATTQGVQPIAVIGMAGQFPKASNLAEFWSNIAAGRDCVSEVPKDRWDIDLYYQEGAAVPGKTNSKWMGALDEYDRFDAAFFNISPREARSMDPQQRLFLQACWQSIEDAGYNPKSFSGGKCGVFVGCSMGDYHQLSRREQLSGQGFTGAAPSILAARISYFLDLHGPSIAIDTACSSSLVAIASACDSLIAGSSDLALAGGVNVMAGPAMHIMTSQVGMLSPDGRCYTFDRRANGIATGEGVGVVLLKRLADAERDRDCIYGVIEGWGLNQDGKTNGITAPNADSQARLQQDVYDKFRIDPASIQLIEAHGTGTALGDPIEVAGLKASFGAYTEKQGYCALGSVKSNIGHCLTAAGVSGFLKLLLALKHEQIPPTLHFEQLNEHIVLDRTPFYVNTRLQEWKRSNNEPRRAAINSFGFSGTNAHIVLRESVQENESTVHNAPIIVPLSARTAEQLEHKARDLLAFVNAFAGSDLRRLAYTLQIGREAMHERLAFVVSSTEDLSRQLRAYVDRGEGGYRAQVGAHKDPLLAIASDADFKQMIVKWIDQQALPKLADLWVKGLALDWSSFYAGTRLPRRMGLPTYPFAKERYWIEPTTEQVDVPVHVPLMPTLVERVEVEHVAQPACVPDVISLEQLQQQLQGSLAAALFMKPSEINVNRSFTELGLDSIVGVEWVGVINKQFGTEITATRIYDYPNVKELAAFLRDAIGGKQTSMTSVPVKAVAKAAPAATVASVSRDELHQELRASLAAALYLKPSDIDVNRLFTELGLDSIIGVEWVKVINQRFGTSLSAIKIYDYPNIKALAEFLSGEMAQALPVAPQATATHDIRFERKVDRDLYFRSQRCDGNFDIDGEISLTYEISPESNVCLREHVVFDEHLLPTDAYIELVYSAYRTYFASDDIAFKNVGIVNPLLGFKGRNTYIRVMFRRQGDDLQFFVRSSASSRFENEKVHVQGFIAPAGKASSPAAGRDFAVLQELSSTQIATNAGTYYAPLKKLQFGESGALGHIQVQPHDFKFLANPFALYGGLCTVINYGAWLVGRVHGASDDHFLPHRVERIALPGPLDADSYVCRAQVKKIERDAVVLDFQITDSGGKVVAIVDGISLRRVARKTIQQQVATVGTAAPAKSKETGVDEKVAIIGVSCRMPMGENIGAFWDNLREGRDCVTEVPAGRWDDYPDWYHPDPRHPHTSYSKWGGFLERIDTFDCLFFGISPAEAELIDPQQRIFLEECWRTIESAGYAPGALSHEACGVYVGCSTSDYTRVLSEAGQATVGAAFMGTSNAILAARIAYFLNLKGPALAIDTACSSSLVAVHLACESIRSGQTQWALAGGINVLATPLGHILTSQVGMPSRDGRCATFDASANGIVFSEGCGVLLLKALSRARADNDTILGVIQASGTNQDGKTNGITAPSANAQEQLLKQVYRNFGVDPRRISYIEAHGTATALGDPIEVNALTSVFKMHGAAPGSCAIGSVKSNIGHTGFAAGVAGIIKVLLCMKHGKLVPSIHYATPNPHLDFAQSPFFVNTEYRDWVSQGPRLAAVSSFGFSGTNAHVVIEEDPNDVAAHVAPTSGKVIVPVSAGTPEQLEQRARDLLCFVRETSEPLDLVRLSYTLQVGRDAMDKRVVFVATSMDDLAAKLDEYVSGKTFIDGVHRAPSVNDSDTLAWFAADEGMRQVVEQWLANGNLSKAAEWWVRGGELGWSKLYAGIPPQRMALPTYPFAKQRCWVEKPDRTRRGALAVEKLHPLVHTNTSDLGQQSYSSTFSGDEFFLTDHRVDGQKMLPAVAYMEMARAAVLSALPTDRRSAHIELRHIVFAQPIAVTTQKHVAIAVFEEGNESIGFEIYSSADEGADEVLHAQGYCSLVGSPKTVTLNLTAIKEQMTQGMVSGRALYPQLDSMGLSYGPAFQGITTIHRGTNQLLVELSLPVTARTSGEGYLLHPSMMDSALQGSILFIGDVMQSSGKPSLPFALETLRIFAPCESEMVAWVRPSGSSCAAHLLKVDIDLCKLDGTVCVQMHGFSSRPLQSAAFDEAHYRSIIAGVLSNQISAEDAADLG